MSATYSRQEVALNHNISEETFKYRAKALGIKAIFKRDRQKTKLYTESQIEDVLNFRKKTTGKKIKIPEVIRITETYYIYQSKMNL